MHGMAFAKELTENRKLGPVSTTYAAIQSCPSTCPLLKSRSCYGMIGPIGYQWSLLKGKGTVKIAKVEAKQIDSLTGFNDLRLHTLGDCSNDTAARIVADAAMRYMHRRHKAAFGYTHAWRKVARRSWGKVSMLASCENTADIRKARAKGWATSLIVTDFKQETAYEIDGIKVIPCPEQTGRCANCVQCRLCMRDDKLKAANVTIAFKGHGPTKKLAAMLSTQRPAPVAVPV